MKLSKNDKNILTIIVLCDNIVTKRKKLEGYMLKIPKKYSVYLSLVVSVVFFLVCAGGSIFMPRIMETLVRLYDTIHAGKSAITRPDLILL